MDDDAGGLVSALDFDTLRSAFKSLVAEGLLPESVWVDHAEEMVRDLTGSRVVDPQIVLRIIRKCRDDASAGYETSHCLI